MATPYEIVRTLASPVFPVLHGRARNDLRQLLKGVETSPARLLDVGGRSSPYTTLLDARVTILDIPRQTEVQQELNLGVDAGVMDRIRRRRSNIETMVLEDMCRCSFPDASFDGMVAVEVIEHVPEDDLFVEQAARVLRPGGWAYFTTPNGDYVKNEPPNYNPDHLRHYTRQQLSDLLGRHFDEVRVVYGVRTGAHRYRGLRSFELRRPVKLFSTLASNVLSHLESRGLDEQSHRTAHLFAIAKKAL